MSFPVSPDALNDRLLCSLRFRKSPPLKNPRSANELLCGMLIVFKFLCCFETVDWATRGRYCVSHLSLKAVFRNRWLTEIKLKGQPAEVQNALKAACARMVIQGWRWSDTENDRSKAFSWAGKPASRDAGRPGVGKGGQKQSGAAETRSWRSTMHDCAISAYTTTWLLLYLSVCAETSVVDLCLEKAYKSCLVFFLDKQHYFSCSKFL